MTRSPSERYVVLGLKLGRHVDGIVDAYWGPPELAAAVDSEPPVDPALLVAEAEELLSELEDGWLRDQVSGCRTYAGVLAGEPIAYADEVERCYGVRPSHTDESVFEAAHEELDGLLPGDGSLAVRHQRWEESIRVPADRIEQTVAAVIETARRWTGRLVDFPDGEGVDLEIVRDEPWLAFCEYLGGLRSRISVNVDLPISALQALVLTLHETYPGHHTERVCKDEALVRGQGRLEETIVLVPTPQSLVAEGIATTAPTMLLEGEGGEELAAVVLDAGVEFDLGEALAIQRAHEPCGWAQVNAALMLHDEGVSGEEVRAYFERWTLMKPEVSAHLIRFLEDPTSRSYMLTYLAGKELCRSYVGGDPERFRHLLTEQVRVGELLAAQPS